jgi:outer membrane receptor protein involved in Fe transport
MKTRLLATTLLVGMSGGLWSSAAIAQDASDEPVVITEEEDAEARLERVQVTGSRIKRPDLDTVFPTQFIDQETFEKNAFTNIADALTQIPAFGGGISPVGNQGANIGANFVDFLDLGVQRTLTLVNGRRFVPGDVGGNGLSVDFNVIPTALIERVDIIGVGGAPVYGSDAIAGTINVILRDDFEGLTASAQYGVSEFGDGDSFQAQVAAGANTADGRGNVTFSVEYFDQQGVSQLDRPGIFTAEPFNSILQPGTAGFADIDGDGDGTPDGVTRQFNQNGDPFNGQNVALFTLGGTPSSGGTFLPNVGVGGFGGDFFQFADNGDLVPLNPGAPIPGQSLFFSQGGDPFDFFNLAGQVQSPLERIVFGSTARYDIFPWARFKVEAQIANTRATELANQGGFQTFAFGGLGSNLVLSADNPFLNQQAQDTLASIGINPGDTFNFQRFNNDLVDGGSRTSESFVWRIAAGFEGDFNFADREFNWDFNGIAGETTNTTFTQPIINDVRFLNAIEAVQLTQADIDAGASGAVGDIVCQVLRDFETGVDPTTIRGIANGSGVVDNAPADVTDCQPLNLFGANNASPEALDFVVQQGPTNNNLDQSIFSANLGGQLVELPAGWAAFSVGYETRRERASFEPGGAVEVGLGRTAATPATGGQFTTNEFVGELFVPLVSPDNEIPFVYNLEAEGTIRRVRNDLAGNATIWTVGGSFSPTQDLTIRGNRTRSIRAPSLVELFEPVVTAFEFANDPCDARFINNGDFAANRAANCAAIGIAQPFTSNVVNATAIGSTGGNPNLGNETANSFSVGLLAQPRWIPGLIIGADFIDINLDDRIGAVSLEANLETCFDTDPADFATQAACDTFTRDAGFQIVDFESGQLNADTNNIQAVLFNASYDFDVADAFNLFGDRVSGDWGQFGLAMNGTRFIQRDLVLGGIPQDQTIGEPFDPRWQGTNDFTYTKGGLRLFWRVLWTDRIEFDPEGDNFFAPDTITLDATGAPVPSAGLTGPAVINTVSGRVLHNASISYDLSEALSNYDNPLTLQLNVNNVLGRTAAFGNQRAFNNRGFAENFGRSFLLTLRAQF